MLVAQGMIMLENQNLGGFKQMFHQSSNNSVQQQIQNCREDLTKIGMIANQLQQSEQQNFTMLQQLQQVEATNAQHLSRVQQAERNAVQQLQQLQQICQEADSHLQFLTNVSNQMNTANISGQSFNQPSGYQQTGYNQYQ